MNRKHLFSIMLVFDIMGLIISGYLTYLSLSPPSACPIGAFSIFSCDEVIWSVYSKVFGVSVALLGFAWFIVAFGIIMLARVSQRFLRGLMVWGLLGAAGVAGFVYTEIFLIGAICVLCTTAHVMGVAILVFSIAAMRYAAPP